MERIFHHYTEWEDYKARMYDPPMLAMIETGESKEERLQKAIEILGTPELCEKYMRQVIDEWKLACEQSLTHKNLNRKAWLGWCACCIGAGIKESETKQAWHYLTEEQRVEANEIADRIIKEWEKRYEEVS